MPAGLQVWDENSNLIVDTPTSMGRIITSTVSTTNTGSVTNAALANGTKFAIPVCNFTFSLGSFGSGVSLNLPKFTFSGSTISWDRGRTGNNNLEPCTMYGGVF